MTTYRYFSPTTVHVLRDGTRIGSLYRGSTGSWSLDCHRSINFARMALHETLAACAILHGKHATPELVAKLNP